MKEHDPAAYTCCVVKDLCKYDFQHLERRGIVQSSSLAPVSQNQEYSLRYAKRQAQVAIRDSFLSTKSQRTSPLFPSLLPKPNLKGPL